MKKLLHIMAMMITGILFGSSAYSLTWIQKTSFSPGVRYGAFSFSIGQKGYVGSGIIEVGPAISIVNDFWEYDPGSDTWTQKATLPASGRSGAATFTALNKGFVTTGNNLTNYLTDTWQYDPAANVWQAMADFPGGPRHTCTGFDISDYGFVGMGRSVGYYSDFYRFNPIDNTWTLVAPIPGTPRQSAKGFSIADYGYVVGGAEEGAMYNSKELWRYDPIIDVWEQKADYTGLGSHGLAAFQISGTAYVGLGTALSTGTQLVFNDFSSYDPATNSWSPSQNFGGGIRQGTVSMTIGNSGFVGMGSTLTYPSVNYQSDWWTFADPTGINDPQTGQEVAIYFDSNHDLNIQLSSALKNNTWLMLYDVSGKLVSRTELKINQQSAMIRIVGLSKGVYYYSLTLSSQKTLSGKALLLY